MGGVQQRSTSEPPPTKRLRRSKVHSSDFKFYCIFCGETCTLEPDVRNPSRWRPSYLCITANRGSELTFKDSILDVCTKRNDEWANQVEVRLRGAVSDLHAADGRYHDSCRNKFMIGRINQDDRCDPTNDTDYAFENLLTKITNDKSKIWTSSEVHERYTLQGGKGCRKTIISKLIAYFNDRLVCFSAPGFSSLLVLRDTVPSVLKLVEDKDDNLMVRNISKTIMHECKDLVPTKNNYTIRVDKKTGIDYVSGTLLSLLGNISDNLSYTLPSIVIGNLITNAVTNRPTPLQIGIGATLVKKKLIEHFHDLGICCSYDKILHFKASVAAAASKVTQLKDIRSADTGLVQAIAYNFDANISTPNGLKSTHSLALLITQVRPPINDSDDDTTIKRLKKENIKVSTPPDIPVSYYHGPKKPDMPETIVKICVLPLKVLAQQSMLVDRSQLYNFDFLKGIATKPSTPEFNGFNTKIARMEAHALKPSTKAVYTPLIDMTPSDPTTMKTAMLEAKRVPNKAGQSTTIFTADLQLYRVGLHVHWAYPELFGEDFVIRLGGMHFLMSFVGAVEILMAGSSLEDVMKAAFGGVSKMLTWKNFPQNTRSLRIVVEAILCDILCEVNTFDELMHELKARSQRSRTTKHWVENLITPVLLIMMFIIELRGKGFGHYICGSLMK